MSIASPLILLFQWDGEVINEHLSELVYMNIHCTERLVLHVDAALHWTAIIFTVEVSNYVAQSQETLYCHQLQR